MRHLHNICHNNLPCDISSCCESNLGSTLLKFFRFQKIPQHHWGSLFVRNLDSNCSFSRDRRFNTNVSGRQIQFDIIGKTDNLTDFYSLLRLKFIACHRWSTTYICHSNTYSKIIKRLLQLVRCLTQMCIGIPTTCFSALQ